MLIDTQTTIAYKCPSCGSFEFINTSLFYGKDNVDAPYICICGKSRMVINRTQAGLSISVPCIGCGGTHLLLLTKKDILFKNIKMFICPETGITQCIAGKDDAVRKSVDRLEKELDELIDTFGYDSYFKNTRVMLDSVNRIHDLAEQGNLHCLCGSHDIELILLSDRIHLICNKCSTIKEIRAASNSDLKEIMAKQQIMLTDEFDTKDIINRNSLMRKRDGK